MKQYYAVIRTGVARCVLANDEEHAKTIAFRKDDSLSEAISLETIELKLAHKRYTELLARRAVKAKEGQ